MKFRSFGNKQLSVLLILLVAFIGFSSAKAENPPVTPTTPVAKEAAGPAVEGAKAGAPAPVTAQPIIPPPAEASPDDILYLDLSTGGRVAIQLYPQIAPGHVERIKTLVRRGFYNGIIFHRVIEGFMAQTGDPTGKGTGDSDLPDLKAEFNKLPHLRGTVSMARTDNPDSANSQFFICFMPNYGLDNKYTIFGRVISGMQYVDTIARGEPPANPDRIVQASIASDNKAAPALPPVAATPAPVVSLPDGN